MKHYAIALAILLAPVVFVITEAQYAGAPLERRVELCVEYLVTYQQPTKRGDALLVCSDRFLGLQGR